MILKTGTRRAANPASSCAAHTTPAKYDTPSADTTASTNTNATSCAGTVTDSRAANGTPVSDPGVAKTPDAPTCTRPSFVGNAVTVTHAHAADVPNATAVPGVGTVRRPFDNDDAESPAFDNPTCNTPMLSVFNTWVLTPSNPATTSCTEGKAPPSAAEVGVDAMSTSPMLLVPGASAAIALTLTHRPSVESPGIGSDEFAVPSTSFVCWNLTPPTSSVAIRSPPDPKFICVLSATLLARALLLLQRCFCAADRWTGAVRSHEQQQNHRVRRT
jgi:hypothetical protein